MDSTRHEPELSDMLEDPIVQALMARDGLDRQAVQHVIDSARRRLHKLPELRD